MSEASRIDLPKTGASHLQVDLSGESGPADRVHLLSLREIHAVNAAIAAGRPLLVRGEPGTGKSQLARAVAKILNRVFISQVIDSRTESRDLLWNFDAVMRLANAQLAGALHQDSQQARQELAVENYLHPGPLWWAFDWADAERQAKRVQQEPPPQPDGGVAQNGSVLLLDEIDKAESETPNGLLEALGARQFTPLGRSKPVCVQGILPLLVITTNEERALPDAFLRRCLVLCLNLPSDEQELIALLMQRGKAHFPTATEELLRKAAEMLFRDRHAALEAQVTPRPGQAEYLDLLRAVLTLERTKAKQLAMLEVVAPYTLRKHVEP
ncbi:AAA family ATPase [Candidatus Magnetaquicoccus inordinatus]|uniref:AAA family ATPase n=1 Tax=Candidatus Magnetaquicoccus inordinatus TaxID=2496818 RepID=UPI00102B9223|nr:MoxR family ATPase [Candidatus Magnetaquicoccus inordinatus]